jgi:hydroxyethylthiazole kinase-like uncharacterized protein yjeF
LDVKVVIAEQMRGLDRQAIEEHGVTGAVLMENAGRAVFEAVRARFGPLEARPVAVFAGTGNNGGDGFVAARHFHQAGALVALKIVGDAARISGDAKTHLDSLNASGIKPGEIPIKPGIKIDALLGTGAKGAPRPEYAEAIREMNALAGPTVAVDIPSGIDADTGEAAGEAVNADVTVTFGYPKLGLFLGRGADCASEIRSDSIGFDWDSLIVDTPYDWLAAGELRRLLSPRPRDAHKGLFGHLLIVGGSRGMSGAPTMAAKAALRSGVGLVTVAAPSSVQPIIAGKIDEVMTIALPEKDGAVQSEASVEIRKASDSATAVCLGPGVTQERGARELMLWALRELNKPLVLDADGLNALADSRLGLSGRKAPLILTPHPGECGRLLGISTANVQADRLGSVRKLAEKHHCIAVLKGANTLIADGRNPASGIRVAINTTGNSGMATGGAGDTLTGIIGALLGQGMDAFDAACIGVYVHGRAGDLAAEELGQRSMMAGDITINLHGAFRELEGNA